MNAQPHPFIDDLLPDAWLYEDALLYIDHDGQAFPAKGFAVHGGPMTNLSPAHLAYWRSSAQAMLNALEISTHLDCYWTVENNYTSFLEGHRTAMPPDAHPIARRLLEERIDFFAKQQVSNQLRYRKLYVFVNLAPPPSRLAHDDAFRRRFNIRCNHRLLLSEWKAAHQKLEQLTQVARQPFEAAGMNTRLLTAQDYRRLFRKMLAPHRFRMGVPEPSSSSGHEHIWTSTVVSDVLRKPPFLHYDEHWHAFVSMTNLPQETRTGFLHHLFSFSHPDYALKITLRTTIKQDEIKHLQSDYGSKKSLQKERERKGKIVDIQMDTEAEEIQNEIRLYTQTPQQIFHGQLLLHLWHPDREELRRRVDEAILKVGYCNGIQAVLEDIAAPEALRACLPGWTREDRLDRFQIMKSVNAADLIPAHTDFIGTGRPQLLFPTPEGGIMTTHVFTHARPIHAVVTGETGGGKTFLLQSILTQLMGQGLKSLTVISTKDEFGPLMAVYGGIKVAFSEDHPVFLNPCAIAGSYPNAAERKGIVSLLETIFGEEPNEMEHKIREARLSKAMAIAFKEHQGKTRLRHFIEVFRKGWEHDDLEALKRLALILEPYSQGGLYGEFFDSDTRKPLDLSNNLKFFDFSAIQDNPNLSAIMMMALTTGETLRLKKLPRHCMKTLVLDECWAFVDSRAGGKFIANALRVNRAYNCAVFLTSQEIWDFINSSIWHVIMNNVHNFFFLRTKEPETIALIQKELQLTDELVARFQRMPDPSDAGYSHFLHVHQAVSPSISGEGLIRVSHPEALLYSTSPNVSQLRDHVLRNATDPWQAVCDLARKSDTELQQLTHQLSTSP
jgi:hypothetical protein